MVLCSFVGFGSMKMIPCGQKHVGIFSVIKYSVRIVYRSILQNRIFTNTEQKYMMLLPCSARTPDDGREMPETCRVV
jgi:hypothetical protein